MSNLASELRDAADACTPSPLQDLLRRAADAVDVKQEPVAWMYRHKCEHVPPDFYCNRLGEFKKPEWAEFPLYTHPAPIPDGMMLVPVEMVEFVKRIKNQIPEKPDHWNSCGQCESNSDMADDLIEAMLKAAGESS